SAANAPDLGPRCEQRTARSQARAPTSAALRSDALAATRSDRRRRRAARHHQTTCLAARQEPRECCHAPAPASPAAVLERDPQDRARWLLPIGAREWRGVAAW